MRDWLINAGVECDGPPPQWAVLLHWSKAWEIMSYREVRMVAESADMQEGVEAVWRMNGSDGVLGLVAESLMKGSR